MKRVPVYRIEGRGWWQKPMKQLREKARAGAESVQLTLLEKPKENLYFPCKYCGSDKCKIARLKPGAADDSYAFPWTRANPPASTARIVLTPCEVLEQKTVYAALGIRTGEVREKVVQEAEPVKPVLTARQTAERILSACSAKKGRTVQKLCELAGIDPSDVVERVLAFLSDNGKITNILGNRWILVMP